MGAISLLFRQTNIVWVAFVAAQALIDRLRLVRQHGLSDPLLKDARPSAFSACSPSSWQTFFLLGDVTDSLLDSGDLTADLVIVPVKLLTAALQDLPTLAPALASYLPVFAAAIAFVRWNGGHIVLGKSAHEGLSLSLSLGKLEQTGRLNDTGRICLETGDKSNHVPTVHVAQVWYFLAFAAALFSPHLLGVSQLERSILGSLQTPRCVGKLPRCWFFWGARVADWRTLLNRAVAYSARSWRSG